MVHHPYCVPLLSVVHSLYPTWGLRMGSDRTVDVVTRPPVQTTVILTAEQDAEIRQLSAEWGDASMASVIRRLINEALANRRAVKVS